ncbi:hypothetical protein [Nonomuraea sp. B19D2]|uniref:hypothetical protein n=1 Tax=Nonomuraea sp. B19D2 TaxID=3159561 RepID=UPI0032D9CB13
MPVDGGHSHLGEAGDVVELQRGAVVHELAAHVMLVGYALAAGHRDRVTRLAVGEAILPGGQTKYRRKG